MKYETVLYYSLYYFNIFSDFFFQKLSKPMTMTEKFVVVLDAGHGGHDPGNLGNGYLEKKYSLKDCLKKVGEILEKKP